MSIPLDMRDGYNNYLITTFGPIVAWRKKFALWPKRSTYSKKLLWLKPVVAGYHVNRIGPDRVVLEQRVINLAEHEYTYLSLAGFKVNNQDF